MIESRIPTKRRGLFDVGPIEIERIDALWLTVGTRRTGQVSPVVVHPKVYDLLGPQGAVRAVENESVIRRASSDPLSGFVSMREYVPGDDPRLIHWPTTARVGTLMIREHVDVRRPEFTVVLDTAPEASAPDDFEEMVDVAASLAVHAIRSGLDVMVRTTDRNHAGRPTPLAADSMVLELLDTGATIGRRRPLEPRHAVHRRLRPHVGGDGDGPDRPVEPVSHDGAADHGTDRRGRVLGPRHRARRAPCPRVRQSLAEHDVNGERSSSCH